MKFLQIGGLFLSLIWSVFPARAQEMQVNVNCLLFDYAKDTAYAELQFLFHGQGLIYGETASGGYQAAVRAEVSFIDVQEHATDHQFVFYGGVYSDTLRKEGRNFYDLVRIPLPYGTYRMKMTLHDAHRPDAKPLLYEQTLQAIFPYSVALSDVQRIAILTPAENLTKYVKNGYDYLPYFSDYYPENIHTMTFSFDVYRTRPFIADSVFKLNTYISKASQNTPYNPTYGKEKIIPIEDVYIHYQSFIIDSLPSGNYYLAAEVRDMKDSLHARSVSFFQRSNPSVNEPILADAQVAVSYDSLKRLLDYIYPIADPSEAAFINRVKPDLYEDMLSFFYSFWQKRFPEDPSAGWGNYYKMVQRVNANYSTLAHKGYKTDRGQCYLKYGPPSGIEYNQGKGRNELFAGTTDLGYGIDHSTDYDRGKGVYSHPYEVWWYNEFPVTHQTGVYFVFVDADMVSKDYKMMHSNALNERKDYLWKAVLEDDGISTPNEMRPKIGGE